jgi:hypothetical protein
VNGKHAGETPFSGSVPICSEVKVGREKAHVELKHKQTVKYIYKMPNGKESNGNAEEEKGYGSLSEVLSEWQSRAEKEQKSVSEIDSIIDNIAAGKTQKNYSVYDRIRFGFKIWASMLIGLSDWAKPDYVKQIDEIDDARIEGRNYKLGLLLNIPFYTSQKEKQIALSPELNFAWREFKYNHFENQKLVENFERNEIAIEIPLLLKYWDFNGVSDYMEAGVQVGFPLKTISGRENPDYGIVLGIGARAFGLRIGYNFGDFNKKHGFSEFVFFIGWLF